MPTSRIKELAWQPKIRDVLAYLFYGFGTASPSDGEGAGTAFKGSLFVDYINGVVYKNDGSRTSPTWTPLGGQANTKYHDEEYLRFGDGTATADESVSDRSFYFESAPDANTGGRLVLDCDAESTTLNYVTGLLVDLDDMFTAVGAKKRWGIAIAGDRSSAVMGGDANDMLLKMDYTNYGVNTPAGSYARGLSVQMTNRTTGVLSALQGGFIGVRQRSSGDVASLEGLQIDCKIDSGMGAPSAEISGLRVELNLCANAPAASYGVVVRNLTDGVYTLPTAAFKALNDGTSSCKGFTYGLDLLTAGQRTALCDIRLSSYDSDGVAGMILSGAGTDDTTIKADLVARGITAAHGSVYISVVKTGGLIYQNRNGTWTAF